jgi:hypothetical protein
MESSRPAWGEILSQKTNKLYSMNMSTLQRHLRKSDINRKLWFIEAFDPCILEGATDPAV